MQRNYLTEKENPYRYGVLLGNYVEEKYANDYTQIQASNHTNPISETRETFPKTVVSKEDPVLQTDLSPNHSQPL